MNKFYNVINGNDYELKTDNEIKSIIYLFIKAEWITNNKRNLFIHELKKQNLSNSDNKHIIRIFDQVTENINNHFINNTSLIGFNLERV